MTITKKTVPAEWWDNVFAPSSCLVLITTIDDQGRPNAAAFGTCVRVCHDPMHIAFTTSIDRDTARNIEANAEFVVNIVPFEREVLQKTLICGLPFKPEISEIDQAGLTELPALKVRPPRIVECRSHFECSVLWTKSWANRMTVCGQVEAVTINEDCIDEAGFIVWEALKPAHYCGGGYGNMFVPVYDAPLEVNWDYQGSDDEFVPGVDWRRGYKPFGGVEQLKFTEAK